MFVFAIASTNFFFVKVGRWDELLELTSFQERTQYLVPLHSVQCIRSLPAVEYGFTAVMHDGDDWLDE
jgi:hypothetical protein